LIGWQQQQQSLLPCPLIAKLLCCQLHARRHHVSCGTLFIIARKLRPVRTALRYLLHLTWCGFRSLTASHPHLSQLRSSSPAGSDEALERARGACNVPMSLVCVWPDSFVATRMPIMNTRAHVYHRASECGMTSVQDRLLCELVAAYGTRWKTISLAFQQRGINRDRRSLMVHWLQVEYCFVFNTRRVACQSVGVTCTLAPGGPAAAAGPLR
jgi:hypothetical protein